MPGQRLPMRKIRDVLRLRAAGMSKRKIAASLAIGVTTAGEAIRRATRAGLSWPLPEALTDAALERLLYPPAPVGAKDRRPQPDWAAVHRELRRPGVTLQLLWEEHRGSLVAISGMRWPKSTDRTRIGRSSPRPNVVTAGSHGLGSSEFRSGAPGRVVSSQPACIRSGRKDEQVPASETLHHTSSHPAWAILRAVRLRNSMDP
jgi:hypothetical protein